MPRGCVLIATYNEADNIAELLADLASHDVYLVDDDSPDGTAEIAREFPNVRVLSRKDKRGIASAYIDGFKWILDEGRGRYDYVVQMDAGLTHDPIFIEAMTSLAEEGAYDLVIGSRDLPNQGIRSHRTLISKAAVHMLRSIGIRQSDVTAGFRAWRFDLLRAFDFDLITSRGFAFQFEMLYHAKKTYGAAVGEYPVSYRLTNSSLDLGILREALLVWMKLAGQTWLPPGGRGRGEPRPVDRRGDRL